MRSKTVNRLLTNMPEHIEVYVDYHVDLVIKHNKYLSSVKKQNKMKKEVTTQKLYSEINIIKCLSNITFIEPLHISLSENSHTHFPNSYILTEKGINYIIEQLKT